MELLLTGFVLIGLFQLPDYLRDILATWESAIGDRSIFKNLLLGIPYRVLLVGVRIMTINLIILLLLRGFWIGMIGLSSAFPGGIDYRNLSLAGRFSEYLKRKSIDTEKLIIRLDDICSSIFALSFLIFFIAISMGLYLVEIQALSSLSQFISEKEGVYYLILNIAVSLAAIFFLFAGLLKVIDFLSAGVLKKIKNKYFVTPYFYVSRFVSAVTLAFVYRPLYYFLVSNIPRKVIRIVLVFYLLVALGVMLNFSYGNHIYYPGRFLDRYGVSSWEYENLRPESPGVIETAMIQSDLISGKYVKLFIPYDVDDNTKLKEFCPELKPVNSSFSSIVSISNLGRKVVEEDVQKALDCFSRYYRVAVDDSIYTDLRTLFTTHSHKGEKGIMKYIPVGRLEEGYHIITIYEIDRKIDSIHFWKEQGS
ncbi:MAG: hypothetical protein GF417_00310 [Candidatus Latescibacteria bacterium]|nr:hypothetical protein [bacterium]MBD3422870.1 hypothetical protein [Candidatus Latescibacterota bacterium]